MKRILESSPVKGYQLFRIQDTKADGTAVLYPNYYIRQSATGKQYCTGTDQLSKAKIKVKKIAGGDAHETRERASGRVHIGELLDLVLADYKANGQNLADAKTKVDGGLRPYFGDKLASSINTSEIEKWIKWRHEHQSKRKDRSIALKPATINRELALLRRAFRLGYERSPQLVDRVPPIKMLHTQNVRKGFITREQYDALMRELPDHLRPITCVAFHVANRRGELLNLKWADVDTDGNPPVLTLWPGETKNKDGRTLPILAGEMMDTLRKLKAYRDDKHPKQEHVFLNATGEPLEPSMMRKAWASACERAGVPDLLFHDLRRSAVRNLRRAGVTQSVAMKFSGHKTDSVFRRYDITDFGDLRDAADRLTKYLGKT